MKNYFLLKLLNLNKWYWKQDWELRMILVIFGSFFIVSPTTSLFIAGVVIFSFAYLAIPILVINSIWGAILDDIGRAIAKHIKD